MLYTDDAGNMTIIDDRSSSEEEEDTESKAIVASPTLSEEDFNQRKSVQLKKYSNSISKEWEISKDMIHNSLHLSPETDLTGPDYCETTQSDNSPANISEKNSDDLTNYEKELPINTVRKKTSSIKSPPQRQASINSVCGPPKTPTKTTKKETAIFYTRVDENQQGATSKSEEDQQLTLEDLEVNDETASSSSATTSDQVISGPSSPTDAHKPKLWSCFPAIKSGSKRTSYKMVTQSPPYMPVSRENTTRYL